MTDQRSAATSHSRRMFLGKVSPMTPVVSLRRGLTSTSWWPLRPEKLLVEAPLRGDLRPRIRAGLGSVGIVADQGGAHFHGRELAPVEAPRGRPASPESAAQKPWA